MVVEKLTTPLIRGGRGPQLATAGKEAYIITSQTSNSLDMYMYQHMYQAIAYFDFFLLVGKFLCKALVLPCNSNSIHTSLTSASGGTP